MDANERVRDLIELTGLLTEVLEKENAGLKAHKAADVRALLEEKTKLARAYEGRIKGLREAPDSLVGADEEMRERLRLMGARMQELMEENSHLLKISITVGRRVMESFAQAVKSVDKGAGTYGANGAVALRKAGRRSAPKGMSVSVNQSL